MRRTNASPSQSKPRRDWSSSHPDKKEEIWEKFSVGPGYLYLQMSVTDERLGIANPRLPDQPVSFPIFTYP